MNLSRITNNSLREPQYRAIITDSQIFDETKDRNDQGAKEKENGRSFPAGKEECDNEEEEKYACAGQGQEGRLKNIMMYADFHQSFSRIVSNHRLSSDNLLNILKDAGKKPPSGEKWGRKKSPFNTLQNEKREVSEQKGSYSKEYASKARIITCSNLNSPKLKISSEELSPNVNSVIAKQGGHKNILENFLKGDKNAAKLNYSTPQKGGGINKLEPQLRNSKAKPPLPATQKKAELKDEALSHIDLKKNSKNQAKNKLHSADSPSPEINPGSHNLHRERQFKFGLYDESNDVRKIVYTEPDYLTDSNMLVNIEKSRHCIVGLQHMRRPNQESTHPETRHTSANPRREPKECKVRTLSSNRVNQVYCLGNKIVSHRKQNLDRYFGGSRTLPTEEEFESGEISETPSRDPYDDHNEEEFMDERKISEDVVYMNGGVGMNKNKLQAGKSEVKVHGENIRNASGPQSLMKIKEEIDKRNKNFILRNTFLMEEKSEEGSSQKYMRFNTEGNHNSRSYFRLESPKKAGLAAPSPIRTTSTANNDDATTSNNDLFNLTEARAILNTSEFAGQAQEKREELHTFSFKSKQQEMKPGASRQAPKDENCAVF